MATEVTMPRLSDSMEEGTVLKWLVEEGAEVKRGEPLVEIETDKANMTYESDTDGVLIEIVAQEGDTLPIGETIARVGEAGEAGGGGAKGDAEPAEQKAEAEPEDDEPKSESKEPAERESSNGGGAGSQAGPCRGPRRRRRLGRRAREGLARGPPRGPATSAWRSPGWRARGPVAAS